MTPFSSGSGITEAGSSLLVRGTTLDDSTLIRQILSGDQDAQNLFYRQYAPRIYPICVHFLGYRDPDAEDLVQETFLIAFRYLDGFEFRSSLYTWLARICVSLCYKRLRKRERLLVSAQEDLEKFAIPLTATREAGIEEEEEKRLRLALLEKLMKSLGEKCREILLLRDRRGESYADISRILKVPIGTVMSQLARCRRALKALVEKEPEGGAV